MPKARSARPAPVALPVTFRAGCGREWTVVSAEPDLAYTEQAFPECPECLHRVEPEGGPPFCALRPVGTAHPFAALAGLDLPE
ncbi:MULTISPECIES: hypothetical protein [Deinococcus]|uniref:hypothetical protein n=1 Tax=Deinococcus TaxID=1298 RepID=UPI0018E00BCE|nr:MULTISPECIES: hypothetical protein [Deinococcus]MBI0447152.1 hypothetical protein [Deinococcus sp. DB0503]